MRVIDASTIVKYVNREPNWREVEKYFLEGCITVDLAIKEVINSIWKRVLRGALSEEDGYKVFRGFIENLMVKIVNQENLLDNAFKIALKQKCTIYDAIYIALAKQEKLELITSDKKQKELAEKENIKIIYIP